MGSNTENEESNNGNQFTIHKIFMPRKFSVKNKNRKKSVIPYYSMDGLSNDVTCNSLW